MAKLMGFSVIGLPHYTIWHLYEPSIDDILHMEEMEKERKLREQEEQAQSDRVEHAKTLSTDSETESSKDRAAVDAKKEQQSSDSPGGKNSKGEEGPATQPADGDSAAPDRG